VSEGEGLRGHVRLFMLRDNSNLSIILTLQDFNEDHHIRKILVSV